MKTQRICEKKNRVQVLHVLSHLDVGGAELRLLDMARHLDWSQFKLHFCVFSGRKGQLAEEIQSLGGEFHALRMGLGFPTAFKKLLRQQNIDTVHAHMHHSAGFVLRLAAQAGVPGRIAHFQSCSDGQGNSIRRRLQRYLMRSWIDRYASNILSCGENAMARSWRSDWKSDPRCQVIFDGIDPELFSEEPDRPEVCREFGISTEKPLFIHVGNIREPKNYPKLVSVFSQVLEKKPAASLLIIGRGGSDYEKGVRKRVAELGISDRVIFTGLRSDVPRLMRAADAMIFPSLWEGLPGAVLEACAAGLPVLASDLAEIREIADWLPLVHLLPLEANDSEWALEALRLGQLGQLCPDVLEAPQAFDASPFNIRACVDASCEVWHQATKDRQIQHQVKAA